MKSTTRPNFFIVGAPKCGTTSMYEYLRIHPEIFMPERKEPQFFSTDFTRHANNDYKYIQNEDEYLALFTRAGDVKCVGEGSTTYFHSRVAAKKIWHFNPEAKIIIMLRNPVDMMYSMYHEQRYNGYEPLPTFEQALAAESVRIAKCDMPERAYTLNVLFYRDIAHYTLHLQRFFEVFGRESVHVIIFDDFKADTTVSYRKTLDFLEVDPDFIPEFQIANPNKESRSSIVRDFLQNPPQVVTSVGQIVMPVARPLYRTLRQINMRHAERIPLDPELRHQLQAEFAPEVERLGQLLERDLSYWCHSER